MKKDSRIVVTCALPGCKCVKPCYPSQIREHNYCCLKHLYADRPRLFGRKVTVKCDNCGADLERSAARIAKQKNHFCNTRCRDDHRKKNPHLTHRDTVYILPKMMLALSNACYDWRSREQISQAHLACMLEMSPVYINRLERCSLRTMPAAKAEALYKTIGLWG